MTPHSHDIESLHAHDHCEEHVHHHDSDPELRKEWEREHSVDVLDYAERKGLGSKVYRLQKID